MSGGLEQIREGLTAHLNGKGIRAVPAWSGTARTFPGGPVAAVSLRGCRWGPAASPSPITTSPRCCFSFWLYYTCGCIVCPFADYTKK